MTSNNVLLMTLAKLTQSQMFALASKYIVLCSHCQAQLTPSSAMFLVHLLRQFYDFMFLRVCRAVPFVVCCMFYVFVTVLHCSVLCILNLCATFLA